MVGGEVDVVCRKLMLMLMLFPGPQETPRHVICERCHAGVMLGYLRLNDHGHHVEEDCCKGSLRSSAPFRRLVCRLLLSVTNLVNKSPPPPIWCELLLEASSKSRQDRAKEVRPSRLVGKVGWGLPAYADVRTNAAETFNVTKRC